VLSLGEVERPAPGADELLIETRAAEVTKADCEMRRFRFPVKWFWLPLRLGFGLLGPRRPVLGCYFSGEIAGLGPGVTGFTEGEAVFGSAGLRMGGYGEYACLPAGATVSKMPANLTHEEAAAIPLGGLNALHFMRRLGVVAGDRVLVNGAGGSIGLFGVQIARAMGAVVTAVDHGDKEAMIRGAGADRFIDYTRAGFAAGEERWDAILDMVAGSSYRACMRALAPNGRYATANPTLLKMLRCALTNRFTGRSAVFAFARESVEELAALRELAEAGRIRPVIDRILPLEQVAEGHRMVESESRNGLVVLSLDHGNGTGGIGT
jgi:NADPH:quinone reductase-like Zn-dependent oxidoreductase